MKRGSAPERSLQIYKIARRDTDHDGIIVGDAGNVYQMRSFTEIFRPLNWAFLEDFDSWIDYHGAEYWFGQVLELPTSQILGTKIGAFR